MKVLRVDWSLIALKAVLVLFLVELFHFDVYICINDVYLLFILITLIFV